MTSVAIMQPTFIPWLGYFALMELSDYFVVLDDVQFAKQSWQSRNQLKGPNGIVRISLSIKRKPSLPLISEVQIAEVGYSEKLIKSVQGCLGTAPHWRVVQNILQEGLSHPEQSLLKVNLTFIKIISNLLGIECKFCLSSSIGFTGSKNGVSAPTGTLKGTALGINVLEICTMDFSIIFPKLSPSLYTFAPEAVSPALPNDFFGITSATASKTIEIPRNGSSIRKRRRIL